MRRRFLLLLLVLLTVAGCSGVPTTSAPQVVRSIPLGESTPTAQVSPPTDADPRVIVQDFLEANATDPDRHDSARAYLQASAAQKWSDATATVIDDNSVVSTFDPTTSTVQVTYQQIGSVSAAGIYTPTLVGSGVGPSTVATFTLARDTNQQWRISVLPAGVFIRSTQFGTYFTARSLYFLNGEGNRLVPDVRYSALPDRALDNFLLTQLIAGPRPELANAVTSEVPSLSGQQRAGLTVGSPTVVQLPGSAAKSNTAKVQLAAQLAATLKPSAYGTSLELQDGTQTVQIPGRNTPFDSGDFADYATVPVDAGDGSDGPTATFVRDGAVFDATGKPVAGNLGAGTFALTSVAFDRSSGAVRVAGTRGPPGASTLLIGDGQTMATAPGLAGVLTRPVWAPGAPAGGEAWVASGNTLSRAVPGPTIAVGTVQATSRTGPVTGAITSLAFSPEGARLALVIANADGTGSQVWLGAVVRSGPDVRLDQLEPITPAGIDVDDVGWTGDDRLLLVGLDAAHPQGSFWSLRVDGSNLVASPTAGLPDRPRTIATNAVTQTPTTTWVTVGIGPATTVWVRQGTGGTWSPPTGNVFSVAGSAPSFSV